MKYLSVYQLMKSGPCAYACRHDGECEKCPEYGDIRQQAASDHNILLNLSVFLSEKCPRHKNRRPCRRADTDCPYKKFCDNAT